MPSAASARAKVVAEPTRRNRSKTERTTAASASLTTSFRSLTSYPSGGYPPIHMPRARDALNLSRMRSPITSRSNWANESKMLSVSRPMLVVVLNDCVTLTNVTLLRPNTSTNLAKSINARLSRSSATRERVELLVQPLLGRFAGVDRTPQFAGWRLVHVAARRFFRPKKTQPFQRVPVMARAMADRDLNARP